MADTTDRVWRDLAGWRDWYDETERPGDEIELEHLPDLVGTDLMWWAWVNLPEGWSIFGPEPTPECMSDEPGDYYCACSPGEWPPPPPGLRAAEME